jgi:uncharacterized protein (DUF433 family)
MELEIELSLREAENAIEHVTGVCGGKPVFRGTRVPVRMVAAMKSQGATTEDIVEGYPSLTVRMVELAEIWTMAYPMSGRPQTFGPWRYGQPHKALFAAAAIRQNLRSPIDPLHIDHKIERGAACRRSANGVMRS